MFAEARVLKGGDEKPNKVVADKYEKLIRNLFQREVNEKNGEDGIIHMSPEAAAIREDIEDLHKALDDSPSVVPALIDHVGKWAGMFSRLCLVFHMTAYSDDKTFDPGSVPVSEATAKKAYSLLVDYILPEQARIYTQVMESGDDQERHARWIAGHILAGGAERITVSEIHRAFGAIASDDWSLKKATASLEIMGWITPDRKANCDLYSRHDFLKMKWRVNSAVHARFAARAEEEKADRAEKMSRIADSAKKIRAIKSRRK